MNILIFTHSELPPKSEAFNYFNFFGITDPRRACYVILNYSSIHSDQSKAIKIHCQHLGQSQLVIFDANFGSPNSPELNQSALNDILSNIKNTLSKDPCKKIFFHILADNQKSFELATNFMEDYIKQNQDEDWFSRANLVVRLLASAVNVQYDAKRIIFMHRQLVDQIRFKPISSDVPELIKFRPK